MSSSNATEDYYMILEVPQTATSEQITKSYRRLAFKFHPDRKASGGSTQAFQLLGQAYATLSDEQERRDYDSIYPSIKRSQTASQNTQPQKPRPPPASTSSPRPEARSEAQDDIARLAALRKAKEERNAIWRATRNALESPMFELRRSVRRLKREIEDLVGLEADENPVAERERRPWASSPFADYSEEKRARRDRERQERRIEKNLKERRLGVQEAELLEKENELVWAKKRFDDEILRDDQAIEAIEAKMRRREARGQWDSQQEEHEKQEKTWREQEEQRRKQEEQRRKQEDQRKKQEDQRKKQEDQRKKQEDERKRQEDERKRQEDERKRQEDERKKQEDLRKKQEDRRKKQEEERAKLQREQQEFRERQAAQRAREELAEALAETARQEEEERWQQRQRDCDHGGWWDKVTQRAPCPKCHDVWNYLLQCPGCETKACPKCQRDMRPRFQRQQGGPNAPRPRSPRPYNHWRG